MPCKYFSGKDMPNRQQTQMAPITSLVTPYKYSYERTYGLHLTFVWAPWYCDSPRTTVIYEVQLPGYQGNA
jgi:hypothetical protein